MVSETKVAFPMFLVAVGVAMAILLLGNSSVEAKPVYRGKPMPKSSAQSLAEKWSRVFELPSFVAVSVMEIESGFHPNKINTSERSKSQGGAWGLMQVTLTTATDLVSRIVKSRPAPGSEIERTLRKWRHTGESLLDPELNAMLGCYYLKSLSLMFGGDFTLTIAAYHQGPGKIKALIREGKDIPAALPPKGREYVAMATEAANRRT